MGLRCLLGHDFDEPETERERNEEGNEVVVTVREVKTCNRCGEKQVVSENKEITSIDQLRESATGEPSAGVDAGTESVDDEWGTDELSSPADTDVDASEGHAGPDDTATAAGSASSPTAESDPTAGVDAEDDSIERGVADIIEQAEKDDDMLEGPAEGSAAGSETEPEVDDAEAESGDAEDGDVPVHPGQRGAEDEESEAPDAERDDGVILDEEAESQPEEARRQWEEEARPEEVPGKDLAVSEPEAPDGEDAEIIDGDAVSDQPSTEPESESEPAAEPAASDVDQQPTETHSAVESEDAEIMDAGPESPEPEPEHRSDEPEPQSGEPEPQSEPASTEREETEDGHMPWPDAPGEDEGHDATAPDGEPADVEFGGGLTPSDPDADDEASGPSEVEPSGSIDRIEDSEDDPATTEPDRANGHRTEDGESDDTSATPTANVNLERSTRDANMEYYCPECGLTRDVGNSSMRAGDICPDCRKGYITEQQKAE